MKLMRQVEANIKKIHKEVSEADKKFLKNEEKIKDINKNQEDELKQRLAKRRNKPRKKSVEIKANVAVLDGE